MPLSSRLLNRFKPPRERNAAEWSQSYAQLPEGDANCGKWRNRPYQHGILKAMSIGSRMKANGAPIRVVVTLKSAQVGQTLCDLNAFGYHIDQKPTNMALYMPSGESASEFGLKHLSKWIRAQDKLHDRITSKLTSDGTSSTTHKKFPGGELSILAANRSADVASRTLKFVIGDECDRYPKEIAGEGDPVKLIYNRTTAYADSLLVWGSTPSGTYEESRIWQMYRQSDMRRFYLPCPHCGKYHYLAWDQFFIPSNGNYAEAGFRCFHCGELYTERHKYDMLKQGQWRTTDKGKGQPGVAGFHIWAAYSDSPTVSWPELAREYEDCKGIKENLITFVNTKLGLPSAASKVNPVKADEIVTHSLTSDYKLIEDNTGLPNEISLLTAGVDVQYPGEDMRIEVSIWGWTRNNQSYFLNHMVIPGNIETEEVWQALHAATNGVYVTKDKKKHLRIDQLFIDAGSGVIAPMVYEQCRKYRHWQPISGHSDPRKKLLEETTTTKTGPLQVRQPLFRIQVSLVKDLLQADLMEFVESDSEDKVKKLKVPYGLDLDIASQWTSEYRTVKPGEVPKVLWLVRPGAGRNEAWDCWVYAFAAKYFLTYLFESKGIWDKLDKKAVSRAEKAKGESQKRKQIYGKRFGGNKFDRF